MPRVYRSSGYPCGIGECKEVCATSGQLGGHRSTHHPQPAPVALVGVPTPPKPEVCTECGLDFGQPQDRTDTADGRSRCGACATVDGVRTEW